MSDPEVVDRLQRLGADPLSEEDALALARHAQADPAARRELARQAAVHGLLGLALEDEARRAAFTARITGALVPEAAAFTAQVVERIAPSSRERGPLARFEDPMRASGPRSRGSRRIAFALAASLAACVLLAVFAAGDAGIARVVRSESTAWITPPPATVQPGTRLRLARGLVEVELLGRGSLIVEGPADLEFAGPMRAVLHRGRLVMHATVAGHGYRVETPAGALVDLGTRFGVSVGADGATEAHVIEGSIEAIASDGAREVLSGASAARLGTAGVELIAADRDAFYTALPPRAAAPDRLHWPLDEGTGDVALAMVRGFANRPAHFSLRAADGGTPPRWVPGRFGQALAFDGRGAYAESPFPGIAGAGARTVACWVRVPRDFTPRDGFAVVSWGHFSSAGRGAVWQLSLNPLAADGPLGRIRVGTHGGLLVGTSDLRDDAWHHVAVVMYGSDGGGDRPDIGTHVLVYVDGELEAISRRTLHAIDTRVDGAGHGVWLGRNVTYTDERRTHPAGFLRGAVDEVVIVAGALDREAILRLRDGDW